MKTVDGYRIEKKTLPNGDEEVNLVSTNIKEETKKETTKKKSFKSN